MNAVETRPAAPASSERHDIGRLGILWAVGTSIAVVLAALVYYLARQEAGALVVAGVGEVTLVSVVGYTVLGGTLGAMLAFASRRFARQPRFTFLTVAVIGLAGYAVVPFTAAESLETAIWLNLIHLVVAIPVVGALDRYVSTGR